MTLLWRQLLNGLSAWLKRQRVTLEVAPNPSQDLWIEPTAGPRFDPSHGVYAPICIDGATFNVILQPDYWHLLNPAISREVKECAIPMHPIGDVVVGKEPPSLVYLQDLTGRTVGMGCRATCGGNTVLLTAWHVLDGARLSDLYLAKANRKTGEAYRVKFDFSWPAEYECSDEAIDLAAVLVPDAVWAKLGVSAARVVKPLANSPVTAFGGECKHPKSSVGRFVPTGLRGIHSCSTRTGWSGTPLYSQGCVVGVHVEWDKVGTSNRATVAYPFHTRQESWGGEYESGAEISDEEMDSRSDVHEYDVKGRGRFRSSGKEYSRTNSAESPSESAIRNT